MKVKVSLLIMLCLSAFNLFGQSIAEKKAGYSPAGSDLTQDMQKVLVQLNKELSEDQAELRRLYADVYALYKRNASPDEYQNLLDQINAIKAEMAERENSWREMATQTGHEPAYALWHQPESTLGQLINDYGSQSYVYVMAPEIAGIKVSVDSNIPIPRSSWNELLETILSQNGVGYKQVNPYLRQLFFLRQDRSSIQLITNQREDLEFLPPDMRISFVVSPEPFDVRRVFAFMEKFLNPQSSLLQMVGRDILIIASVAEVQDMLKLYDFVCANKGDKEYKIRTVTRVDAGEMAKILAALFDQLFETPKGEGKGSERGNREQRGAHALVEIQKDRKEPLPPASSSTSEVNGLKIIPLSHIAQAIFLIGTKEEIKKAEEIIDQVESQVGEARSRQIHWYTARHSNAEELAQILERIYTLMVRTYPREGGPGPGGPFGPEGGPGMPPPMDMPPPPVVQLKPPLLELPPNPYLPSKLYQNDFYQQGGYVVNPAPVEPGRLPQIPPNMNRNNFIVDMKTGAIVMVVEADIWPKLKELIKKLDVPKTMVQIEALVFEKRLSRQDNFGLNLLRLGDAAANKNVSGLVFNGNLPRHLTSLFEDFTTTTARRGVFEFILGHKGSHGVPAFDLVYKFLISQADVQINANPSVVTVNQVPARISIVEEISINTGVFLVDTVKGITPENAFTRAQYGINILVTPTVHMSQDCETGDGLNYVTLDSDIVFDTFSGSSGTNQPNVLRRHVTNQVRIPDGQTVIIGGLRRKNTDDGKEAIPYLGEIPGFGKLFSNSVMHEDSIEMFVFLTPKIISDPSTDFECLKEKEMLRRPGDIPEFMCKLYEAELEEKNRLFAGTMNALFGPPLERCVPEFTCCPPMGEYHGR